MYNDSRLKPIGASAPMWDMSRTGIVLGVIE